MLREELGTVPATRSSEGWSHHRLQDQGLGRQTVCCGGSGLGPSLGRSISGLWGWREGSRATEGAGGASRPTAGTHTAGWVTWKGPSVHPGAQHPPQTQAHRWREDSGTRAVMAHAERTAQSTQVPTVQIGTRRGHTQSAAGETQHTRRRKQSQSKCIRTDHSRVTRSSRSVHDFLTSPPKLPGPGTPRSQANRDRW